MLKQSPESASSAATSRVTPGDGDTDLGYSSGYKGASIKSNTERQTGLCAGFPLPKPGQFSAFQFDLPSSIDSR